MGVEIPSSDWSKMGGVVYLVCPGCGARVALNHDVADDGKITPSLDCPSCEFHDYARLLGWSG